MVSEIIQNNQSLKKTQGCSLLMFMNNKRVDPSRSEKSQYYDEIPQLNCTFINSLSGEQLV
jgi:hypothetical protein